MGQRGLVMILNFVFKQHLFKLVVHLIFDLLLLLLKSRVCNIHTLLNFFIGFMNLLDFSSFFQEEVAVRVLSDLLTKMLRFAEVSEFTGIP